MKRKIFTFLCACACVVAVPVSLVACNGNGNTVNKLSTENGITLDGAFENDSVLNSRYIMPPTANKERRLLLR